MKNANILDIIQKIISTMIVAGAFTLVVSPSLSIYLFFADTILFLVLIIYAAVNNTQFFKRCLVVLIGTGVGFVTVKLLTGYHLRCLYKQEIICVIFMMVELVIVICCCLFPPCKKSEDEDTIYEERKYDLQRIKRYIMDVQIMGINAGWGVGKTFLMECMKKEKEIQDQFDIIQIDLLSCDLDHVELILVEELEKVFKKNRIYPDNSHEMKKILGKNQWLEWLVNLVTDSKEGMAASFHGYREEFGKLSKKILVIFEDIDRINEKKTIQKIFAISENLACDNLHIVYQYDDGNLEKIGFTRDYLEKYIPFVVGLTEITYERLVDYQWDKLNMSETSLDKRDVRDICRKRSKEYQVEKILGLDFNMPMRVDNASVRKVQIFLRDLKIIISGDEKYDDKESIDIVISSVFIKHFFYEYYKQFRIGESPLNTAWFIWQGKHYTLDEILVKFQKPKQESEIERNNRIAKLQKLMESKENREAYCILRLLGYNLQVQRLEPNTKMENYVIESLETMKYGEQNEKIDRILWNVMASGTSEITNAQNAVDKLVEEVLCETGEKQQKAWEKYLSDMYNGNLRKNTSTIFRIGVNAYLSLFQAFKVCDMDSKKWSAFLKFYFLQYERKEKNITLQLIDNLNYCDTYNKQLFFQIIRFFNQLQVDGNFNRDKSYKQFFESYMGAVATLGYSKKHDYWMFQMGSLLSDNLGFAVNLLESLRNDLLEQVTRQPFDFVKEEFYDCIHFVEKNLTLIQAEKSNKRSNPSVSVVESKSEWIHQKEVNRLKKLKQLWLNGEIDESTFNDELEKSYQAGNIYLPELNDVLEAVNHVVPWSIRG